MANYSFQKSQVSRHFKLKVIFHRPRDETLILSVDLAQEAHSKGFGPTGGFR